jgi:predicted nucleic acid-binding protein
MAASQRWQISYWDATIVEAARSAECQSILSDDLQHGHDFDGIRILNPFR